MSGSFIIIIICFQWDINPLLLRFLVVVNAGAKSFLKYKILIQFWIERHPDRHMKVITRIYNSIPNHRFVLAPCRSSLVTPGAGGTERRLYEGRGRWLTNERDLYERNRGSASQQQRRRGNRSVTLLLIASSQRRTSPLAWQRCAVQWTPTNHSRSSENFSVTHILF